MSKYKGKTVNLNLQTCLYGRPRELKHEGFRVEDLYEVVSGGKSIPVAALTGNLAARGYLIRMEGIGFDDSKGDRYYGKLGNLGYIVHESEIVEPDETP